MGASKNGHRLGVGKHCGGVGGRLVRVIRPSDQRWELGTVFQRVAESHIRENGE